MVLFFTHIPFVVNHTINATPPERLQQHPLLFTTNRTDRTFFLWRLNSARPPHPGHSTILLRSEIPSGMCPKLRTVAASKNRDHARNLSYYCLLGLQIWWCNSSCTSRSWWITQSTQHRQRGCNSSLVSSKHFSEILPPNGWYPEPGKVGQGGLKVLHLWRHSQKTHTLKQKIFFRGQTRRLAVSFDALTRSITWTGAEIFPRKATCV